MNTYSTFTEAYKDIVRDTYNNFEYESAPRGQKIREKLSVTFELTDPRNRSVAVLARNWNPCYCAAEALWYISGNDSTEWISKYASFWRGISDDGETANSAYGARIFKPHPRIAGGVSVKWTQWEYIISELQSDQDSRRAIIHLRSPQDSILAKRDVPCTIALQFLIRDSRLHLIAVMRSNDAILGLANDVPAFTLFQEMMLLELNGRGLDLSLGRYIHTANSMHLYERHFEMARKICEENVGAPSSDEEIGKLPNIQEMLNIEDSLRAARNETDIKCIVSYSRNVLSPYWVNQVKLLAAHHAKAISKDLYRDLMISSGHELYVK